MTDKTETDHPEVAYGSNEIRLDLKEWIITVVIVLLGVILIPSYWKSQEIFEPNANYRLPFDLSQDYYLYNRWLDKSVGDKKILLIGDSVVWGEYVKPEQTLAQKLNAKENKNIFVNGGVNGLYPLAIEGLLINYGSQLKNQKVIITLNLLWLSSPQRDLSYVTTDEVSFNHKKLIPQFFADIPVYKKVPICFNNTGTFSL